MECIGMKGGKKGMKSRVKLFKENEAEEVDVITTDTRTQIYIKIWYTIKYVHHIWYSVRTAS